ncbi:MAG TPA: flagellar filament capping protein FliD [Pseudomonas sp.]|jgi:flagellar hook-associated protein 2|uniref:flagellar filament capping protein FliD n=1 Tax=Pseudomonas sp. TaxID=306 RepID=UPI002C142009|nr:flagellar filament capping protein FliD [Pseudomonas sp.]HTO19618.1 flagellar filament capping protein FliD [Pseudomonas sp.]
MTTYDSNYAYTMATQLAQYDTQYSYSRLDRNKTNYTAQQTAINSLSSALSTFQTKLTSLNSVSGSILQNKATLSSEGYATANVTSKAQAGSYQFFVKQLASKDQVALQSLPASGSLQIGQPGNAEATGLTVDLADAAYQTGGTLDLSKLAADINAQAKTNKLGVSATLVRSGGVTNLVLTSEKTGVAQKISLSLDGADEATTAASLGSKQLSAAKDAIVYLGADEASGIALTNSSNTYDNIIDGVSLTFSKAHATGDAPLSIDIAQDNDGTKAKVQEFVDAYNALAGELKKLTASGSEDSKRGPLAGDGTVRSIKSMIDNLIRKGVTVDGQQISLVSLGISNTREGTLTLDSARLDKTLASNPGALDTLFKGTGGTDKGILGALLDRETGLAKYTSSVNGILKNRKDTIADSLKRVEKERERVDTQYDNLYQRYLSQYTNLVTIMNQMNQTSSLYFT